MLDSVIRVHKKCSSYALLEECKYKIKKNKMENLINDDFDSSLPDESDNESDSDPDSELNSEPNSEPDSEPDNETDNDESND